MILKLQISAIISNRLGSWMLNGYSVGKKVLFFCICLAEVQPVPNLIREGISEN